MTHGQAVPDEVGYRFRVKRMLNMKINSGSIAALVRKIGKIFRNKKQLSLVEEFRPPPVWKRFIEKRIVRGIRDRYACSNHHGASRVVDSCLVIEEEIQHEYLHILGKAYVGSEARRNKDQPVRST